MALAEELTGGFEWEATLGLAAIGTTRTAVTPVLIEDNPEH